MSLVVRLLAGAQSTSILVAAMELGVFAAVGDRTRSADEIATAIGCPVRSTRVLCDALVAIGLLERGYRLTPDAAPLVPGEPSYLGDLAELYAHPTLLRAQLDLARAVRAGGSVLGENAESPRHPFWETFARASGVMVGPAAEALDARLDRWLSRRDHTDVVDVACGGGLYGLVLGQRPGVDVTLIDWPNVLTEARANAARMNVAPSYLEGDVFSLALPAHDLAIVSHLFHHFDLDRCAQLIARIAGVLRPGGRFVIHDLFADEPAAALFSITMLLWTKRGQAHRRDEYERLCNAGGLSIVGVFPSAGLPSSFLIAEKPS